MKGNSEDTGEQKLGHRRPKIVAGAFNLNEADAEEVDFNDEAGDK